MQRASLASLHMVHNGPHGLLVLLSYNPRPNMLKILILLLAIGLVGCGENESVGTPVPTQTLRPRIQPQITPTAEAIQTVAPLETIGPTPTPLSHQIVEGDTLLSIAIGYGIELADLLLANPGINPRFLVIGDQLTIPRSGAQGPIPSATPVPVLLSDVACYETSAEVLNCLLTAAVPGEEPVEGIVALVTLADDRGNALQTEPAYGPTNLVKPGLPLPLIATFEGHAQDFSFATASALSALRAGDISARYAELRQEIQSAEVAPNRQSGTVNGIVDVLSAELAPTESVRVVVIAFGEDDLPVGVRTLDIEGGGSAFEFQTTVYSLGSPIERIEVLSEAAYLP